MLVAAQLPASATERDLNKIAEQCGIQLKLPNATCACIAGAASHKLSDQQQAFMVAQITKDQASLARMQSELMIGEMTAVGNFMTSIIGQCQR